ATSARGDATALLFETIDVSTFLTQLQPGENVLAIQLLNIDAADNDLLVLPQLVAMVEPQPFAVTQTSTLKARVVIDGQWSAIAQTDFSVSVPAGPESLRISEVHFHPADPTEEEWAAGFDSADE